MDLGSNSCSCTNTKSRGPFRGSDRWTLSDHWAHPHSVSELLDEKMPNAEGVCDGNLCKL